MGTEFGSMPIDFAFFSANAGVTGCLSDSEALIIYFHWYLFALSLPEAIADVTLRFLLYDFEYINHVQVIDWKQIWSGFLF